MSAKLTTRERRLLWWLAGVPESMLVGQKDRAGIGLENHGYAIRELTGNRQARVTITPAGRAALTPAEDDKAQSGMGL